MSTDAKEMAQQLAEDAVEAVAAAEGKSLTQAQVVSFAQQLAELAADLVTGRAIKKANADADAAASKIQTLEDAEASAGKPR